MTQKARNIQLGALTVGNTQPFVLIAGPCQIESAAPAMETAV
ncbi:MAG: 3-deoxy-8-phosphooctulonate synthase, partial [Acetobacter orientalis]